MGQKYKGYLYAIGNNNESNLSNKEKDQGTERAKTERNNAYLERGFRGNKIKQMPTWNCM